MWIICECFSVFLFSFPWEVKQPSRLTQITIKINAITSFGWFITIPNNDPLQCQFEAMNIWIIVPTTKTSDFVEEKLNMILRKLVCQNILLWHACTCQQLLSYSLH